MLAKYSLLESGLNSVLFADKSSVGFFTSVGFIVFIFGLLSINSSMIIFWFCCFG